MSGNEPQGRLIRPYAITGGRTGAGAVDLELETQVQTTPQGREDQQRYRWEAAKVIGVAREPMAVVEIAARLGIPIGVARVVVSDLIKEGALELIEKHEEASYADLLERVLDGIRNL